MNLARQTSLAQSNNGIGLIGVLVLGVAAAYFADKKMNATVEKNIRRDIQAEQQRIKAAWDRNGSDLWSLTQTQPHTQRSEPSTGNQGTLTLEPLMNQRFSGSEPQIEPIEPTVNHATVQPDWGKHPLEDCPLILDKDGNLEQVNAVRYCLFKNYSQTKTIQLVWGIAKGGSADYEAARSLFQDIKSDYDLEQIKG